MLRVCRADSSSELAHLSEVTTCGTSLFAKRESNESCESRRDTPRVMMPITMIRTTTNASASLVPIFMFPRNIPYLLVTVFDTRTPRPGGVEMRNQLRNYC